MAELVKVTRNYGGLEGMRVRAGTVFAIGSRPVAGYQTVSPARAQALKGIGLVQEYDPKTEQLVGAQKPVRYQIGTQDAVRQPNPHPLAVRPARPLKPKNADTPPEPSQIQNPAAAAGSQTGPGSQPSSSQAAPASSNVPLGSRGRRQAAKPAGSP